MALPMTQTGDFTPIIKYDSRAGRFYRMDRHQDVQGKYSSTPVEIKFQAAMDFTALEVGWIAFKLGVPTFSLVPFSQSGSKLPPKPFDDDREASEKFRAGFRVPVLIDIDGTKEVRRFSHSAGGVYKAFSTLHDAYLASPEAVDAGKAPVVVVVKTEAIKSIKNGSINHYPVFSIVKWVDRPFEFDALRDSTQGVSADKPHPEEPGSDDEDTLPF